MIYDKRTDLPKPYKHFKKISKHANISRMQIGYTERAASAAFNSENAHV